MKKAFLVFLIAIFFLNFLNSQNWGGGISLNQGIISLYNRDHHSPENQMKSIPGASSFLGIEVSRKINKHFHIISGFQLSILNFGWKGDFVDPAHASGRDIFLVKNHYWGTRLAIGLRFETKKGFYTSLGVQISPQFFTWGKEINNDSQRNHDWSEFAYGFAINPGFQIEAGYRFTLGKQSLYLGPQFWGMYENNFLWQYFWSVGLKGAICFEFIKRH